VYIQYMKFARRSESIKESRAIFKRAREDSRTNFHVCIIINFQYLLVSVYIFWLQ